MPPEYSLRLTRLFVAATNVSMNTKRKITPSYFDERRGRWTAFDVSPDRIIIRKGKPKSHWVVTGLSVAVVALCLLSLTATVHGVVCLAGVIAVATWILLVQRFNDKKKFPTIITKNRRLDKDLYPGATIHEAVEIKRIFVHENKNRDKAEDAHLIQIYATIKTLEKPLLLYQDFYTMDRVQQTEAIAETFRSWLSTKSA